MKDKLRKKVEGWMVDVLYFAGRMELIKFVLHSTLLYWIQTYSSLVCVIKEWREFVPLFFGKTSCTL